LLPLWAEAVLFAVAAVATGWALSSRRGERALRERLEARERGGHFLGESPDTRQIVRHACEAAAEILPLARLDLYRIDAAGTIEEVWRVPFPAPDRRPEPAIDPGHPSLGLPVDAVRLRELTATETDHSFAPRDLLSGGPHPRLLRLPLYAGDRLIAYLELEAREEIDPARRGEIRALLPPLTASLHALRNWTIAVTDELSGLSSRRYFETRLSEEWARRRRYGGSMAVACFDLDRFKSINDSLGHGAGDRAIRRFGEIVRGAVRGSDVACRYGGEEFAILFPESDASAAAAVAERVRRALEAQRFEMGGRPFRVTVSAGVAQAPDASDRDQLLVRADQALYRAKAGGRNRVRIWSPEPQPARDPG
jgi:diguanylate cyclase (GGDEF)-like protein